jgi:hypothetical protein
MWKHFTTREKLLIGIPALLWAIGPLSQEHYLEGTPVVKTGRLICLLLTVGLYFYFRLDVKARIKQSEADTRKLKSEEFRERYKAQQTTEEDV